MRAGRREEEESLGEARREKKRGGERGKGKRNEMEKGMVGREVKGEEVRKGGKKTRWVMEREKGRKGLVSGWKGAVKGRERGIHVYCPKQDFSSLLV